MNRKPFLNNNRIKLLSKPINGLGVLRKQFASDILRLIPYTIKRLERKGKAKTSRIIGKYDEKTYRKLFDRYSVIPKTPSKNQKRLIRDIVRDLMGGVPLWRSPYFHYNVGAAVNRISSTLYGIALDLNIFNINDGLSGNTIIAEHAITRILAKLAGVDQEKCYGIFTFGGTATNLYGIKLGVAKAFPRSAQNGLVGNIQVAVTEDSHFSHLNALNWIGVGAKNALIINGKDDRTSDIADARVKLTEALKAGVTVPAIIINGGTTYDNAIDDIQAFVELRNELVQDFNLAYVPHIHIDSVIGWVWLMFKDYDFDKNPLGIEANTARLIKDQYRKISKLSLADSWGVDFHKGAGTCPIPCSMIIINDGATVASLSWDEKVDTHQLSREFSEFSPVDYTLETSRPAGAPLAALGAINALGAEGYQIHLANLIQQNQLMRELFVHEKRDDVRVLNQQSPGYVTMIRIYPPNFATERKLELSSTEDGSAFVNNTNSYMKSFFTFDTKDRMLHGKGVEYSYSSKYVVAPNGAKLSALKFYPTSPHIDSKHVYEAVATFLKQKDKFDKANL